MKKLLVMVLLLAVLVSGVLLASEIRRGGIVNITPMKQGVLIMNFNPYSPNALEVAFGCFYESLIYYNQMTGRIMPWLAKEYVWSDDLKSITFVLRDDVKWNDGTPFTIADVLFTMELAKNNVALDVSGIWAQGLVDVVAKSSDSITFTFDRVNTTVIERFSDFFIVPKHIWSNVADPLTWAGNVNPVGTGAFIYEQGSFTEQSFRVVRNPNYWQMGVDGKPLPYIDGIQYISTTNVQVPFQLARGEYDWAGYFVANIDEVYVKANPEHHKYWLPEGNMVFLNLNNGKEPFDNYNLRLAVAYGIDQEEITRIMASGAVPSSIAGVKSAYLHLAEEALEKYDVEYDPDYSQYLIEREGYTLNRRGIYEKDGRALSMNLYVPTGWTDWIAGGEEIVRQLREIGIEAILTQAAWPSPYKDMMFNGNYEMLFGISQTGTNPHFQFDTWTHSRHWAPVGETAGNEWGMRYKNPIIDEALDAYTKTPDPDEQDKYISIVIEQFLKDMPSVPLFFNPVWFQYNTSRFVGWPSPENPYALPRPNSMHKMPILLSIHLRN